MLPPPSQPSVRGRRPRDTVVAEAEEEPPVRGEAKRLAVFGVWKG